MTNNGPALPPVPSGLGNEELIQAINDRLRRIPLAGSASTPAKASAPLAPPAPGVPSAPGTPVSTTTRVIALTIAATAVALTASGSTETIAATPTLQNADGAENMTWWYSPDGGRQVYWLDWQAYYPGVTTAVDFQLPVPTQAQAGGPTSNNFILYAAMGAIAGSATTPIAGSDLPAGYVASNALTLVAAAPSGKALTATLTNIAGSPATQANIYMGSNGQNPWAQVFVNLQTPGTDDPNAVTYAIGVIWTDINGNPIAPGGVSNTSGWQNYVAGIPNNGQPWQGNLEINYPAAGVDGYLTFQIWGIGQNPGTGQQTPPFTGNPNAVLETCWGGVSYTRLHVGPPPSASASTNPAVSILPDWQFAVDALGPLPSYSEWAWAGNVSIRNDGSGSTGGVANYARLTGPGSAVYTNVILPAGQAAYFAFTARSNNPGGSHNDVSLLVTAFDSKLNIVPVNGYSINAFTVTGPASSWENPAASGMLLMPPNVASVQVVVTVDDLAPANLYWDVTNIVVQAVQNQTSSGQTNTQVPQAQSAGYSAVAAAAEATTQSATYGLAYMEMVGTAGENIVLETGGGDTSISAASPPYGFQALMATTPSQSTIAVYGPGGLYMAFGATSAGLFIDVGGTDGYTGAVAGRNCKNGIVI